jgi:uncharacterized protein (DUF433 family)
MNAYDLFNHIAIDQAIMRGKPCIKGTTVTVDLVCTKMYAGYKLYQVMDQHNLTKEQITAARLYNTLARKGQLPRLPTLNTQAQTTNNPC